MRGPLSPPSAAGSGRRTFSAGSAARSGRDGHRTDVRPKLEITQGELLEGAPILEEDHLAVSLGSGLKPDTQLGHRRVADILALLVDTTAPMGPSNDEATLSDRRKYGDP